MKSWLMSLAVLMTFGAVPGPHLSAGNPESILLSAGDLGITLLPLARLQFQAAQPEGRENDLELAATDRAAGYLARQQERAAVIDELLLERGVYGEGLDEAYAESGKLHADHGDHQQAARFYRNAWQVSRINTGLYSEAQLGYLSSLIDSLVELEQWDEVHELHQLSFLIASQVYPPDDIRYLIAADLYASWKWEAINGNFLSGGYRRAFETAQQLSAFYAEVIDRVEHARGSQAPGLINLVADKARTDLSLARALTSSQLARDALDAGSYLPETRCDDAGYDQQGSSRRCRQIHLALYDIDDGAVPSVRFALGRYLGQVNQSVERLERMRAAAGQLDDEQSVWIDSLITTLRRESSALSRPGRRR